MRILEVRTEYTFLREGESGVFNFLEKLLPEVIIHITNYIYSRVRAVTGFDLFYFNFTRSLPTSSVKSPSRYRGPFISDNIRSKRWCLVGSGLKHL